MVDCEDALLLAFATLVVGAIFGVFILHPMIFPSSASDEDSKIYPIEIISVTGKIGGGDYEQQIQDTNGKIWILDSEAGNLTDIIIGKNYSVRYYTRNLFSRYYRIDQIEPAGDA